MEIQEAKKRFIQSWGQLAVNWGINRTMGQVHAFLLSSNSPKCSDQIMDDLSLSRGIVNKNLHELLDWGLIYKAPKENGCRKEYFYAEKSMDAIFKQIVKNRKKRELEPLMDLVNICSEIKPQCEESQSFCNTLSEIKTFSIKADSALENLIKLDSHWMAGPLMKMFK